MKKTPYSIFQISAFFLTAVLSQGCASQPSIDPSQKASNATLSEKDPKFIVKNKTLFLVNEDGTHEMAPVETIPVGRKFYRWVSEAEASRVDGLGCYPPHEVNEKVNQLKHQRQGNGLYASTRSMDSRFFGEKMLIIEPTIDLFLINGETLRIHEHLKELKPLSNPSKEPENLNRINGVNRGLRDAGIHGTFRFREQGIDFNESWIVFFHPSALTNVRGNSD